MNNNKIVAFVEPSFYGVSYAKAAFDLGYKVISIVSSKDNPKKYGYDGFYHDLIVADIRDVNSILNAIKDSEYFGKIDALIPGLDYTSHITAKVGEILGLRGNSYESALKARNKDFAREAYAKHNVPSVKYKKVKSYEEAELAAEEIGYPIVIKPTNCAASQNVFFIDNPAELKIAMDKMISFKTTFMDFKVREEYLIEGYIDGQEFSVELFLKDGNPIFSVVTEKITSPLPYFVELVHTLPTSRYQENQEEISNTAVDAAKSLGIMNGPCHVEVKLSEKGPKIIEVNGRPGGDNICSDLLVHALGVDIFKATINYYLDSNIDMKPTKSRAAAIAYLTSERSGIVSEIKGLEHIQSSENLIRYQISVKPGDSVRIAEDSEDRLGYFITVGDTPVEAKESALELLNNIKLIYQE